MASFYLLRAIFLKAKLDNEATEDYFLNKLSKILNKFTEKYNDKTYSSSESGAKDLFKDLLESAKSSDVLDENFFTKYNKNSNTNTWLENYKKDV